MRFERKPPFDMPVAKMRRLSTHSSLSSLSSIAFTKPMSSTPLIADWPQQAPAFHELLSPFGCTATKPSVSALAFMLESSASWPEFEE